MPKYHRIQIDDRAYKALIAESIGRDGVDIRDIASRILIDGVSKEALSYSGQFSATFDDEVPSEIKASGPLPGASEVAVKIAENAKVARKAPTGKTNPGGKKVPVSDEIKAEVRKRKLEEPGLSNRKIAQQIGISPAMVNKILAVKKESMD